MEKKLSELFIEKKRFEALRHDVMSLQDVKIYGKILLLEYNHLLAYKSEMEEFEKKLKKIAKEHGIKDYKI